jgi:hypothetical protein
MRESLPSNLQCERSKDFLDNETETVVCAEDWRRRQNEGKRDKWFQLTGCLLAVPLHAEGTVVGRFEPSSGILAPFNRFWRYCAPKSNPPVPEFQVFLCLLAVAQRSDRQELHTASVRK